MYDHHLVVIDLDKLYMTLTIGFTIQIVVNIVAMSLFEIFSWNFSKMYSRHAPSN